MSALREALERRLPEYNERRPCPKCGGQATTRYDSRFGRDCISRNCVRCGYGWSEAPLDQAASK